VNLIKNQKSEQKALEAFTFTIKIGLRIYI